MRKTRIAAALLLLSLSGEVKAADGETTLCWVAPTENVDGTALTDLAGYNVYWGSSRRAYGDSFNIDDPDLTCYLLSGFARGDYYFAMTALDGESNESAYSNEVIKTITGRGSPVNPILIPIASSGVELDDFD